MLRVALVDLGMGNLRSVERAIMRAGSDASIPCTVERTADPERVRLADKVVVPGQGAFRDCAVALSSGMGDVIRERIRAGVPFLGICLGLHALFDGSDEAPGAPGLGIFRGRCQRLLPGPIDSTTDQPIKIPHMGWNRLAFLRPGVGPLSVLEQEGQGAYVYFVHSFHAVPEDPSVLVATTTHGPNVVTAAIQRDNVTATQFHPEKSQNVGLALLAEFLKV